MCSGIEAPSVALEPIGFRARWFAEIEPFPSAVLAHHYPSVPNHGDMTKLIRRILTGAIEAPPLAIAGTPCQAFSVAGWREGMRRDTPPRRGEGQDIAGHAPFGPALQCGCGHLFDLSLGQWGCPNCEGDEGPAVEVMAGVPAFGGENQAGSLFRAPALTAHGVRNDFASETFCVREVSGTLPSAGRAAGSATGQDAYAGLLVADEHRRARRLTPREWERLQGFPDDYTLIPWRGKPATECPDGPRYKAIGNSKAVPVVRWIGRRLKAHLEKLS
ncbi:TPA: DNA cytosine methyltransferase [Pseudomonas aeruginosa]|uniref:DNA cytosine methyltransferase n=1 Tax=Pseudomonas aeruginosa TaxID=287 RepID=UPI0029BFC2AB|nr:DNA cytosine methyltransferase [Pseudomonas aeruginosa]HBO3173947.1 DNA cytosine methyltransferase [Pseudomonas aeruginosa]HBO4698727.1 DNA cytosine methyltransferase [Pseudomonas aeruginosa]HCF4415417.1 DNA cytosine methyltransferase [Pseudomonas aeruginosa]HCK4326522.1 DNA cytosine methyltransferase [Pseudomonas aeruginosa]HCK4342439.1 DNA cytosine methyltransferase [Pseudomonas aeruginosa]